MFSEARLPEFSAVCMLCSHCTSTGLFAGVDDVGAGSVDVSHTKNDEEFGSRISKGILYYISTYTHYTV